MARSTDMPSLHDRTGHDRHRGADREPLGQRPKRGDRGGIERASVTVATTDQGFSGAAVRPATPTAPCDRFCAITELYNPLNAVAAFDDAPTVVQPDVGIRLVGLGDSAPLRKGGGGAMHFVCSVAGVETETSLQTRSAKTQRAAVNG